MKSIYITLRFCVTILIYLKDPPRASSNLIVSLSICPSVCKKNPKNNKQTNQPTNQQNLTWAVLLIFFFDFSSNTNSKNLSPLSALGNFCEGLMVISIRNDATIPPSEEPHPFIDIEVTPSLSAKKNYHSMKASKIGSFSMTENGHYVPFPQKKDSSYFLKWEF